MGGENPPMRFSTEWLVVGFILLVFAGVVYQAYLAGHLLLLVVMLPVGLGLIYAVNRLTGR